MRARTTAIQLSQAMDDAGTDEELLENTLRTITASEMPEVQRQWQTITDTQLRDRIGGELSEDALMRALMILKNPIEDPSEAEARNRVLRLFNAHGEQTEFESIDTEEYSLVKARAKIDTSKLSKKGKYIYTLNIGDLYGEVPPATAQIIFTLK